MWVKLCHMCHRPPRAKEFFAASKNVIFVLVSQNYTKKCKNLEVKNLAVLIDFVQIWHFWVAPVGGTGGTSLCISGCRRARATSPGLFCSADSHASIEPVALVIGRLDPEKTLVAHKNVPPVPPQKFALSHETVQFSTLRFLHFLMEFVSTRTKIILKPTGKASFARCSRWHRWHILTHIYFFSPKGAWKTPSTWKFSISRFLHILDQLYLTFQNIPFLPSGDVFFAGQGGGTFGVLVAPAHSGIWWHMGSVYMRGLQICIN